MVLRTRITRDKSKFPAEISQIAYATLRQLRIILTLQEMINRGVEVGAVLVQHGWLEFDTVADYEKITDAHQNGSLDQICKF